MFASAISDRGRERFKSSCCGIDASIDRDEARTLQLPISKNGLKFRPYFATQGYEFGAKRNVRARNLRESSYRE